MRNCRCISSESWKTLSWNEKTPWLISLICDSFYLEIQSPTGLVIGPVLFTATLQKKQSRHNNGLSIGYCLGEKAKEGHGQPHRCACGVNARGQPGGQRGRKGSAKDLLQL